MYSSVHVFHLSALIFIIQVDKPITSVTFKFLEPELEFYTAFTTYYLYDQIEEDVMFWACRTHRGMRNAIAIGKPEGNKLLGRLRLRK